MRFVRWLDVRHGKRKTRKGRKGKRKDFLKLHFIVDATSLLILSFKVTPPFKSDSKQVEYLLSFIKNDLGRLCADKAYLSRKICNLIAKCGGAPFISIKKNVVKVRSKGSKAWKEMLFLYRKQEAVSQKLSQKESG